MRLPGNIGLMGICFAFLVICSSCYEEIVLEKEQQSNPHTLLTINHADGITDLANNRVLFTMVGTENDLFSKITRQKSAFLPGE